MCSTPCQPRQSRVPAISRAGARFLACFGSSPSARASSLARVVGLEAAVGQLLDPVGQPRDQVGAVEGRRRLAVQLVPQRLQLGRRHLRQGRQSRGDAVGHAAVLRGLDRSGRHAPLGREVQSNLLPVTAAAPSWRARRRRMPAARISATSPRRCAAVSWSIGPLTVLTAATVCGSARLARGCRSAAPRLCGTRRMRWAGPVSERDRRAATRPTTCRSPRPRPTLRRSAAAAALRRALRPDRELAAPWHRQIPAGLAGRGSASAARTGRAAGTGSEDGRAAQQAPRGPASAAAGWRADRQWTAAGR